ncbi:PREDICTED: EGF domain-specific O-linked [Prunus dulcis]|uniref:PREDICTED: EGF domain-specific O-linked n=1 Tax=Prunus dulcis TaxID=3755 RepID=A0A5E4FTZ7_PRUDU|nr:PREDICTED: EGF domain-specific O-linked [Prunus dulcis]
MVYHQRYQQRKKGEVGTEEDEECQAFITECANSGYYKRTRPKLLSFLLLSLLSCSFILASHLFYSDATFSLYSLEVENEGLAADKVANAPLGSSISNGTISCDRSSFRSDICIMKGDVRTQSPSSSIFVYRSRDKSSFTNYLWGLVEEHENREELQQEKIKPYTRKWETSTMDTVTELDLIAKKESPGMKHQCDVQHDVPAVFFSTGGYTGNVYHEFNDGILPLYITSQHLSKKVVFVILDFHKWWLMKYGDIISHLSDYPVIDFSADMRTHCFPEAIVGMRIHNELTVDSSLMDGDKSILDFRNLLDRAYRPRVRSLIREQEANQKLSVSVSPTSKSSLRIKRKVHEHSLKRPKLVIISRNGSRTITNENLLAKMAEKIGFRVEVLRPESSTELAKIYWALNSSDVMIGVHGAAMAHFLFMRPGSVFIQVIPLGTAWAAEAYYGEPARKLGLEYIGYQILATESSLYGKYGKDDPVVTNPRSVTKKGWEYTKKIYLEDQTVRLHLRRFRKQLVGAYNYTIDRI